MDDTSTEDLLREVPLFTGLSRKEIKQLAEVCLPKSFPAGTNIIDEGKPGLGLFVITAGKVDVFRGRGDAKRIVGTHEAGTIIGEMSLVDDQPRAASVVTLEPTECLLVTRDSFRTLVEKHPAIAWSIVPVITQRFRQTEQLLLEIMDASEGVAPTQGGNEPAAEAAAEKKEGEEQPQRLSSERMLDLLRVEYALCVSGAEGLGRSAGIMETFIRSLARGTELEREQELDRLLKVFPKALKEALSDALAEGENLPERMLATFRRELHRR